MENEFDLTEYKKIISKVKELVDQILYSNSDCITQEMVEIAQELSAKKTILYATK